MSRTDIIFSNCYDNVHIIGYNKVKITIFLTFNSLILSIPSLVMKLGSIFSFYHQRRASKIVIHHPSTGIYTPRVHLTHLSNSNNVTIEVLNGHTKQSLRLVPCSSVNVMVKPIILQTNDTTKISTRYS